VCCLLIFLTKWAWRLQMVAQKQTLLSALPADNSLSAASQIQSQAALDKQVRQLSSNCQGMPSLAHPRWMHDVRECGKPHS
jgi:hypothetical protein